MLAWLMRGFLAAAFLASPAVAEIYTKGNTDRELGEALFCLNYFLWDFPNRFESTKGIVAVEKELGTLIGKRDPTHVAEMVTLYARRIKEKPEPTDFERFLCENHYLGRPPETSD